MMYLLKDPLSGAFYRSYRSSSDDSDSSKTGGSSSDSESEGRRTTRTKHSSKKGRTIEESIHIHLL
jgi:hypothetical protein